MYCLQSRPYIFQPGNFTGLGSEGVKPHRVRRGKRRDRGEISALIKLPKAVGRLSELYIVLSTFPYILRHRFCLFVCCFVLFVCVLFLFGLGLYVYCCCFWGGLSAFDQKFFR